MPHVEPAAARRFAASLGLPRYVLQLAVLLRLTLYDLLHAPDAVLDYKAEMKEMYQSGASMYHIAQLYGTDAKTVARWVKQ